MPKVIITGATGLLGRAIFTSFEAAGWETIGTGLSRTGQGIVKVDLLDDAAVKELVEKESPDFIVHSAADRSPDSVAANPDRARELNVGAATKLSKLASSQRVPLLYISTDYVFPGVKGEAPYLEGDIPRATNLYGQLKLDGEKLILGSVDTAKNGIPFSAVLRLPVLYGHVDQDIGNKESAVNVLVDKVKDCVAGKKVVMDDWARRFPTNVQDIGDAIVQIGDKWLFCLHHSVTAEQMPTGPQFPRILHFSAKECLTKYEICKIFADIMGEDISAMERDTNGGGGGGVQRPYDTQLATGKLEELIGGPLKTVSFKEWWQRELQEHA